ncbi:glycosyltransferase [Oculatella sp. LEGE 06141]|uniref:glycosyltransferase n=1 Tax=Oculatella sp. LEGE 06141 TaxID=1828648 RepID=UPI00187E5904|nr:glycosyltransferase [Oculatella sp. LEGE 06141]MBE9178292.1 glycosyltransferase [Oculatella sp. LEGE 06141]
MQLAPLTAQPSSYQTIKTKLQHHETLRVLFINDLGFQYGAGIALLRQVQSFLVMGHEVCALSWVQGDTEGAIDPTPAGASGTWLGMTSLPYLHSDQGISQECIIGTIALEARLRNPDVIILGNLHAAHWSLRLLPALQALGCAVVAFMHDCYLVTGRCAYTGGCNLYEMGCNDTCPTWNQYPKLEPDKIFDEWVLRRQIFCGQAGIPIAANSQWTLEMARRSLRGLTHADCVYYGLDEQLFKPIDKSLARRLLGIPQDSFVILGGAVNVSDYRKGGHLFNQVVQTLKDEVYFLAFGATSQAQTGIRGTGLLRDYRKMPLVYSAADIFVGTSLEEAFGQTFCEAAACALPVVAFNLDGIPEVARHNLNARLANQTTAEALLQEIEFFRQNPAKRQAFGAAGRAMVEAEFTFKAQGDRWMNYLTHLTALDPYR